jgi:hypothetical protein
MTSQSSTRTTASGRTYPDHFHDQDLYRSSEIDPPEGSEYALLQVSKAATDNGFKSIFHAALALAQQGDPASQDQIVDFAEDGSLRDLIELLCRKDIRLAYLSAGTRSDLEELLCETAGTIYLEEWRKWIRQRGIRMPLKDFSLEHVQSFNIETLYAGWRDKAPRLFSLFEGMASGKDSQDWPASAVRSVDVSAGNINEKVRKNYRRRCRHIVMAISGIGALSSHRINLVPGIISYFMYSCRVPKRVITILNKWGITVAYSSVHQAVRGIG